VLIYAAEATITQHRRTQTNLEMFSYYFRSSFNYRVAQRLVLLASTVLIAEFIAFLRLRFSFRLLQLSPVVLQLHLP